MSMQYLQYFILRVHCLFKSATRIWFFEIWTSLIFCKNWRNFPHFYRNWGHFAIPIKFDKIHLQITNSFLFVKIIAAQSLKRWKFLDCALEHKPMKFLVISILAVMMWKPQKLPLQSIAKSEWYRSATCTAFFSVVFYAVIRADFKWHLSVSILFDVIDILW